VGDRVLCDSPGTEANDLRKDFTYTVSSVEPYLGSSTVHWVSLKERGGLPVYAWRFSHANEGDPPLATTHPWGVGTILTPIPSKIPSGGSYLKEGEPYEVVKVVNGNQQLRLRRLSDDKVMGPWNRDRFKRYSSLSPQEADMPTTVNSFFRVSLFVPPSEDNPNGDMLVSQAVIVSPSASAAYQKVLLDKAPTFPNIDANLIKGEVTPVQATHPC
jgi:hypothetical protein